MKMNKMLFGHNYEFKSIKEVLAKANEQKSGDTLAGIGAENAKERVAAKYVLADLTVEEVTNSPAVEYEKTALPALFLMIWILLNMKNQKTHHRRATRKSA